MQTTFDAGAWVCMIIISFTCLALYKKIGALILPVAVVFFLISGLVVLTGEDVAFFQSQNPSISTITLKNGSGSVISTQTTVITIPQNQTSYLIGNGQFPITGTVQLVIGWSLIVLALIVGIITLDQTLRGNLIRGD